jgi:hypothetical protein
MMEKQVVLKGIMTIEDWQKILTDINFDYAKDNYFTELKNAEIAQNRVQLVQTYDQAGIIGKYVSHEYIRKEVMMQSEEDIEEMDKQIDTENNSGDHRWINPGIEQNIEMMNQMEMQNQQNQMQMDAMQQPQQEEEPDEKTEQLRQAMIFIDQMKQKGKENRSMQDEAKFKSALQLIAQNKDVIKSMGISTRNVVAK